MTAQSDGTSLDKSKARKLESRRTNGLLTAEVGWPTKSDGDQKGPAGAKGYDIDVEYFLEMSYLSAWDFSWKKC